MDRIECSRSPEYAPISQTDIEALEDLLFDKDEVIPREAYQEIYGDAPLGVLVRSIVGLDRDAAMSVFAEFLQQSPLHPDQIRFLHEVVEYLVKNGVMEPKELFDAPFTHYHDSGVSGVLGEDLAAKVVQLVKQINANAAVA